MELEIVTERKGKGATESFEDSFIKSKKQRGTERKKALKTLTCSTIKGSKVQPQWEIDHEYNVYNVAIPPIRIIR